MSQTISLLVGGLGNGAVIAMVAVGIVLIFRSTAIVNFAQGELLMIGAYAAAVSAMVFGATNVVTYTLQWLLAAAIGAGAGVILFLIVSKVMCRDDELGIIIGTLGIQVLAHAGIRSVFSDVPRAGSAAISDDWSIVILGTPITGNILLIFLTTVALVLSLLALFKLTNIGRAMLAVAEDKKQAALFGIPVNAVVCGSCALAGGICGIGGLLLSPITGVFPQMGSELVLAAFVAAVVGGFSNIWGAFIGGLLVGVLQTFSAAYFGGTMRDVSMFVILVVIMLFCPGGLFPEKSIRRA